MVTINQSKTYQNKRIKKEEKGEEETKAEREQETYRKSNDIVTPCYNLDILDFMAESRLIEYMIVLFYFMFILLFSLFFFSLSLHSSFSSYFRCCRPISSDIFLLLSMLEWIEKCQVFSIVIRISVKTSNDTL